LPLDEVGATVGFFGGQGAGGFGETDGLGFAGGFDAQGCGDETGLGRQICWEAAQECRWAFTPVNFGREKTALGFELMDQLAAARKRFPRAAPDIAADYFALRKEHRAGRWTFREEPNPLNAASHCDIAWAGALASRAHAQAPGILAAVL